MLSQASSENPVSLYAFMSLTAVSANCFLILGSARGDTQGDVVGCLPGEPGFLEPCPTLGLAEATDSCSQASFLHKKKIINNRGGPTQ